MDESLTVVSDGSNRNIAESPTSIPSEPSPQTPSPVRDSSPSPVGVPLGAAPIRLQPHYKKDFLLRGGVPGRKKYVRNIQGSLTCDVEDYHSKETTFSATLGTTKSFRNKMQGAAGKTNYNCSEEMESSTGRIDRSSLSSKFSTLDATSIVSIEEDFITEPSSEEDDEEEVADVADAGGIEDAREDGEEMGSDDVENVRFSIDPLQSKKPRKTFDHKQGFVSVEKRVDKTGFVGNSGFGAMASRKAAKKRAQEEMMKQRVKEALKKTGTEFNFSKTASFSSPQNQKVAKMVLDVLAEQDGVQIKMSHVHMVYRSLRAVASDGKDSRLRYKTREKKALRRMGALRHPDLANSNEYKVALEKLQYAARLDVASSEEETDGNTVYVRNIAWQSDELRDFKRLLDEKCKPRPVQEVRSINNAQSNRKILEGVPSWAIK